MWNSKGLIIHVNVYRNSLMIKGKMKLLINNIEAKANRILILSSSKLLLPVKIITPFQCRCQCHQTVYQRTVMAVDRQVLMVRQWALACQSAQVDESLVSTWMEASLVEVLLVYQVLFVVLFFWGNVSLIFLIADAM